MIEDEMTEAEFKALMIEEMCGNGDHNWTHIYGGEAYCSRCHKDIQDD